MGVTFFEKKYFLSDFYQKNNCATYVDIMLNQFNSSVIDLHLKRFSSRLTSQKIISLQYRKKINNFARFFQQKKIARQEKVTPHKYQLVTA